MKPWLLILPDCSINVHAVEAICDSPEKRTEIILSSGEIVLTKVPRHELEEAIGRMGT